MVLADARTIADRVPLLLWSLWDGPGFFSRLELKTTVKNQSWRATFNQRKGVTNTMLQDLGRLVPQHAIWLVCGNVPPAGMKHAAPAVPMYSRDRGKRIRIYASEWRSMLRTATTLEARYSLLYRSVQSCADFRFWLEAATGIGAETWHSYLLQRRSVSNRVLELVGEYLPEHAAWLITGTVPRPAAQHLAPRRPVFSLDEVRTLRPHARAAIR